MHCWKSYPLHLIMTILSSQAISSTKGLIASGLSIWHEGTLLPLCAGTMRIEFCGYGRR